MQKSWRSPIYNFFHTDVSIDYESERLYHFFKCAARACKTPMGGVRRYQDSKDRNSTANLTHLSAYYSRLQLSWQSRGFCIYVVVYGLRKILMSRPPSDHGSWASQEEAKGPYLPFRYR
jgi:hypothetical protein